ncbi:MAG: hypothetical protein ACK481_06910 [Candidatus Melainabacteria bacterium]|jgi:hypothetical protein
MIETIFLRNCILKASQDEEYYKQKFSKEYSQMFAQALLNAEEIPEDFYYKRIVTCILNESLNELNNGNISLSLFHIQLIHDLPTSIEEEKKWNDEWFYSVRLPNYLIELQNAEKVKSIIKYLERK